MPHNIKRTLIILAVFTNVFTPVNPQYAMPMYPPAAVYAVPAPVPVPVAVAIRLPSSTTTTTTTTTPEPSGIAIAMPVAVPMPYALPAAPRPAFCSRPNGCPPCPPCVCLPSCTPAFFSYCSSCHQKCRCRNPESAPVPLPPPAQPYPVPIPVVGPPPVMVVPLPPVVRVPQHRPSSSSSEGTNYYSSSCESSDSRGCGTNYNRRRRKFWRRRRRRPLYRRQMNEGDASEGSSSDFVKPVLSYVSENGEVKYKTKISKNDARKMLESHKEDMKSAKRSGDSISASSSNRKLGRRYDKVLLRKSLTNEVLKEGNNQVIFEPPPDKKIKKVAVSFQVS